MTKYDNRYREVQLSQQRIAKVGKDCPEFMMMLEFVVRQFCFKIH